MNVSCPECGSVFRVDPAKVPSTTVRARCSVCGGVITVSAGSSLEDEFSSNSSAPSTGRTTERADAMVAQRANAALAAAMLDTSPARVPKGPTPASTAMPNVVPDANRAAVAEKAPIAKPAAPPAAPPGGRPLLFPPRPMMPGNAPSSGAAARSLVAPRPAAPAATNAAPPSSAPRPSAPNLAAPTANAVAAPTANAVAAPPPASSPAPRPGT